MGRVAVWTGNLSGRGSPVIVVGGRGGSSSGRGQILGPMRVFGTWMVWNLIAVFITFILIVSEGICSGSGIENIGINEAKYRFLPLYLSLNSRVLHRRVVSS